MSGLSYALVHTEGRKNRLLLKRLAIFKKINILNVFGTPPHRPASLQNSFSGLRQQGVNLRIEKNTSHVIINSPGSGQIEKDPVTILQGFNLQNIIL